MSKQQTILVTDSGLGGLSVLNSIANRLETHSPWQQVRLVYFNAWPAPHRGYNHFPTPEKRARVFHNAMEAMARFEPDVILIACNTLSVIYPHTRFSTQTSIHVEGIVDHGVNMLYDCLTRDPNGTAVVLGTPTTASARTHETGLAAQGISPDRIITVACTDLAGRIEREPFSPIVQEMITTYAGQAVDRLGSAPGRVYAALCCTHFGYKGSLFQNAFDALIPGRTELLNPNEEMAAARIQDRNQTSPATDKADIEFRVVSQAVWTPEQIASCIDMLDPASPSVAQALHNYEQNNDLFSTD